jgi:serine/threonine protein kinase
MGVVYEAEDLELGRRVALKLIAPEFGDQVFRERFVAESRLAASIEHPAVLPIYRAAEADGALFLSMRLIAGDDLAALVRHRGPVAPNARPRSLRRSPARRIRRCRAPSQCLLVIQ